MAAGALDQQLVAHSEVFQAASIRGAHASDLADRIAKKGNRQIGVQVKPDPPKARMLERNRATT